MKYRKLSGPFSVQLEVTTACNNNCVHCYNHWREPGKDKNSTLDEKELNFILEKLIQKKVFSVTLTGGEPLLAWKILPLAIKKLSLNKIEVGLNSNAILLEKEIALVLKESGLRSVLVSILADNEEVHDRIACCRGAFTRTVKGIETAICAGLKVSANMVLLKSNFDRVYKTAQLLKELGATSFSVTKASPALNSRVFDELRPAREQVQKSLFVLEKVKEKLGLKVDILECYPLCLIGDISRFSYFSRRSCMAGVTTCTISPSGEIRPCSHSDMIYGNIFSDNGIDKAWEKMSDWRDGKYIPSECKKCRYVYLCSGGCRMEAKYSGDICGKDLYSTGPDDVFKSEPEDSNSLDIDPAQQYRLRKNIVWREEEFGVVMKVDDSIILLNKDAHNLLNDLGKKDYILATDLRQRGEDDVKSIQDFLCHLIKKKIIEVL